MTSSVRWLPVFLCVSAAIPEEATPTGEAVGNLPVGDALPSADLNQPVPDQGKEKAYSMFFVQISMWWITGYQLFAICALWFSNGANTGKIFFCLRMLYLCLEVRKLTSFWDSKSRVKNQQILVVVKFSWSELIRLPFALAKQLHHMQKCTN